MGGRRTRTVIVEPHVLAIRFQCWDKTIDVVDEQGAALLEVRDYPDAPVQFAVDGFGLYQFHERRAFAVSITYEWIA